MITRKATNKALELADAGMITYRDLAIMALKWMSEDDVAEMLKANEIGIEDEDEDDEYDEDEEEDFIDSTYHDYSEEELRAMDAFDNLNDEEDF